jgi:putative restriction endonuclease
MAATLSKNDLLYVISQSIYDCGWNLFYISDIHPFKFKIFDNNESHNIKIIIYNITHGGGHRRAADEYRIQMKIPTLLNEDNFKTLILGYYPELNVFAGWDMQKHLGNVGYSSSFQIREENLYNASNFGFSICKKDNEELAIAFRPDMFIEYIKNLEILHTFGESKKDFSILDEITKNEMATNDELINKISNKSRQTVVVNINRKQRDNNFRSKVLRAYNHKCAFSGIQLKLVDAAHILPVYHEKSTDDICNGIALSALCHRAYDKGLITFNKQYKTIINLEEIENLKEIKLSGGFDNFKNSLRKIIDIPPAISDRPNVNFVEMANSLRGWNKKIDAFA